ncbi:hypothetical protein HYH02_007155 [Chlamydomonas schloesseri]|uniref:Uncharacterized protein n=1 Tax=Chlamydomonas schloesseri TaxID=2026947 RepID=A0A836B4X0_9CHLO|nr:hypothetical protein HYH02_007155 [Chlamydomonas schloesseri]|eukprot:KAG2447695.1 hypothetical protein HYH02_007155 [Chlamydomonas schloesseri]
MKKTQFHTNPVVNKWEEDQRRARMDKMISRAKSTLPPEARGLSKPPGPKKPSPYTQEMNAPRRGAKRASGSGEGTGHEGATGDGVVAVNVQELDGLIYNRLQEILGMPIMRKAAAARVASGTKGTPPKPPRGRRPAWNDEWNAGPAASPGNIDEKPVGPAGGRPASGIGSGLGSQRDKGSPVAPGSGGRPRATSARDITPTRTTSATHRTASPPPLDIQHGAATGSTQRRLSSGIPSYGAGERVVLLPSPSAASPGAAMRPSSRYGAGPEAGGGGGHVLDRSTVSAIAALNPTAPAAQEAAARLQHYGSAAGAAQQRDAAGPRSSTAPASGSAPADADATFASYLGASPSASAAGRQHQPGLRAGGLGGSTSSGPGGDAAAMRSLMSLSTASPGGSPGLAGMGGVASSGAMGSRRPPLAPRASSAVASSSAMGAYGSPPHGSGLATASHGSPVRAEAGGGAEEDDAYADEEFEEYEGSDGEGGGQDEEDNPAALLRQSVNALHGLVQMKIKQEELARSQAGSLGTGGHRQSQASHHAGRGPADHAADMMASMALAGADDEDGAGGGGGGLGGSSLMDGLHQSDLEYLARLGGAEPGQYDPGHSGDDRAFVLEPGAPAGKTKAWGDRQPWSNEPVDNTTGMDVLRQRQEKERQRAEQLRQQQQEQMVGKQSRAGPADGVVHLRSSGASAAGMGPGRRASSSHAEDEDSVLLGETLTQGRSGGAMVGAIGAVLTEAGLAGPEPTRSSADPSAACRMQAVSNALAALASSGKINPSEAKELRSQTDALYGSLLQLHQLMSGPRGNELRSPTPSGGGLSPAGGFTPNAQSPRSSPNASQQAAVAAAAAAVAADGRGAPRPRALVQLPLDRADQRRASDYDGGGGAGRTAGSGAPGSHVQLTPKNRLVAEDVAWMAGLVHSLSESLHNSKGEVELPGL